ncbi:hypothetical protein BGP_6647 [Beggiatoa sp. PS]|nr:hypothetical protein BGP_6647 [Beggiatoa sp. PS]
MYLEFKALALPNCAKAKALDSNETIEELYSLIF